MGVWNPWRGCHRYSEGCEYCYIHKGDAKRGVDTNVIVKTPQFDAPIVRLKNGEYKMKPGPVVYLCFSTDFLIEEADEWRKECFAMIRERSDLQFLFLTKRIERFMQCVPEDWGDGYDNVIVTCTVENQERADERLRIFREVPAKHKNVACQPMIGPIDLSEHLDFIDSVVLGGESDKEARPFHYEWALSVRDQCAKAGVSFCFRQCGTHTIKDGKEYTIPTRQLMSQARKAGIDLA